MKQKMLFFRLPLLLLLVSALLPAQTNPTFSGLVIFGDSLSDTGNVAHDVQAKYGVRYPSEAFNYTDGRFTDGAATKPAARAYFGVWVEQLATALGLPAVAASSTGGADYAYGDATTEDGTTLVTVGLLSLPVKNMGQQVSDYLARPTPPDPNALFLVWGGGNDFFNNATLDNVPVVAARVTALVERLARGGAVNILVPNLPPLGTLPTYSGQSDTAAALNAGTALYRNVLNADLDALQMRLASAGVPLHLYRLDIFSLYFEIAHNPAARGFVNVTDQSQGNAGINPDQYLFWDGIHPTTAGQNQIALSALGVLKAGPTAPSVPQFTAASVVNGASLTGSIASGAWVSIFGQNLASTTRIWNTNDFGGGKLPTALSGVSVTINGKPAYIYYISPTQLNVLAPVDSTTGPVTVQVTTSAGQSASVTVQKAAASPAFFQFDPQGRKYIAAEFGDYSLVGPAGLFGTAATTRPAKPGEIVVLYATGLGATSPAYPDGEILPTVYPLAVTPTVTIGGVPGMVHFAGLVAPGLYQVNVEVPALPDGDSSVVMDLGGGVTSAAGVSYLAIRN